ncbi:MAG: sulfotransferase [Symploca sp. SIO2B6]|nr:sulfotransferase [Symploca sp. SIO2B6]
MSEFVIKNPIMIGGCGSSGTSLLSHLLNSHPSIYCGSELFLLNKKKLYNDNSFKYLKSKFRSILNKNSRNRLTKIFNPGNTIPTTGILKHDLLGDSTYTEKRQDVTFIYEPESHGFTIEEVLKITDKAENLKDFVDNLFGILLARTGKNRWAEKTPTNCYCIGEFLSLYPSGKYVHIVRDGRDVVPSLIKRGTSPEIAVRRWIHDTSMGLPYRNNSRYYEVKYEDLVINPKLTLNKLMNFLGESEDADLMIAGQTQSESMNSHSTWTTKTTDPISKKAIGKWKRESYENKHYLEQLFHYTKLYSEVSLSLGLDKEFNANDLLLKFGYNPSENWQPTPKYSQKLVVHFLQEKIGEVLCRKKMYCQVLL